MNQSFVISVLAYTIVLLLFNIIKDVYISVKKINIPDDTNKRFTNRWLISYAIGVILLYFIYGRDGP